MRERKSARLLSEEEPQIGDFEYISFNENEIKDVLLGMFSEEIQRTSRITDIHRWEDGKTKEKRFILRIEKQHDKD